MHFWRPAGRWAFRSRFTSCSRLSAYLVRPHLTLWNAAAPRPVLVLLLQVLAIGAVLLFPALIYLFRTFGPRDEPPIRTVERTRPS